jgi:biofilm PGA synthesis protein PgaA
VREALASVARARGRPRLALEELRLAIGAANPAGLGSSADESELLLDLGRTSEAYEVLEQARRREPDAGSVRRASARWSLLQRPELPLETTYTRSSDNSPFGSQEWRVVGWGFAPPIQRDFRLFARVFETGATFPNETVNWLRGAVGGEWTPADWRLRADFAAGADARPGGTLSARFLPTDNWDFGAHLGTATDAVPLQAWRAGILLDVDAGAEAAYAWSEASRVALSAGWLVFGDGNLRRSLLGSVKQRLGVAGAFRFDGALWLSASDNSAASAAYFNPSGSASASAEVTTVFRTWERLDRAFEQRLTLSGGGAWQADFGTKPAFSARYDHAWRLGPALQLDYGLNYSSNPYDGVQTRAFGIHLGLDWRI